MDYSLNDNDDDENNNEYAEMAENLPPRRRSTSGKGSSDAAASPSALSSMLNRTHELSALFDSLGVLGIALMACVSRGWRSALCQYRAETPCIEDLDDDWLRQQLQLWNRRDHGRVRHFRRHFVLSVLPRFYTGLRQLRLLRGAVEAQIDTSFMSVANQALSQLISKGCCRQLRELEVHELRFDDVSLTMVAGGCRHLQKATFNCSPLQRLSISDVGLAALAQGCKQLQELRIPTSHRFAGSITHEGMMAVARGCRLLESLELPAWSQVEDAGLIALGQCCPQLRSVTGKGWTRITDAAVIALASGCPQLEVVQLAHASLTDASADALAQGCPNLKLLDFFGTRITAAGLLTLARHARQPRLRIRASCELPAATLLVRPPRGGHTGRQRDPLQVQSDHPAEEAHGRLLQPARHLLELCPLPV